MPQQQQRLIQLSLVSTVFFLLLGVYLAATRYFAKKQEPANPVRRHTVESPPDDALKYWTADKQRKAQPAPMPNTDKVKPDKVKPDKRKRPPHKAEEQDEE